jgi:hypothetical protein
MRVSQSVVGRVKEGQMEQAISLSSEAAKLVGRHGGDVRLFLTTAAGEQVNSTLFTIEYDSPEAMGRAFDAMNADPELQTLTMKLNDPASPTVLTSVSMGMELPIGREPKQGRGNLLEVHTNRVTPGQMEEFLSQAAEVCAFVESNGAVNARVIQLTYAGMASGMTAFCWEIENWQAHASLGNAWFSDAGLTLQARSITANPPSMQISSAVYSAIPL